MQVYMYIFEKKWLHCNGVTLYLYIRNILCTMMIMSCCNVWTYGYERGAIIYHIICPHNRTYGINTLRSRRNRCPFVDDNFKCIFLNENVGISNKISLKFVHRGILASVQITAWRVPGDKPFSVPMMVSLVTYICVTRPQWFNISKKNQLSWKRYQANLRTVR